MERVYHKLVRDFIPRILEADGKKPLISILPDSDFLVELDKKLDEETAEYQESKELEELADILEVIECICRARGYTVEDVLAVKKEKASARGGFRDKVFLWGIEEQG